MRQLAAVGRGGSAAGASLLTTGKPPPVASHHGFHSHTAGGRWSRCRRPLTPRRRRSGSAAWIRGGWKHAQRETSTPRWMRFLYPSCHSAATTWFNRNRQSRRVRRVSVINGFDTHCFEHMRGREHIAFIHYWGSSAEQNTDFFLKSRFYVYMVKKALVASRLLGCLRCMSMVHMVYGWLL